MEAITLVFPAIHLARLVLPVAVVLGFLAVALVGLRSGLGVATVVGLRLVGLLLWREHDPRREDDEIEEARHVNGHCVVRSVLPAVRGFIGLIRGLCTLTLGSRGRRTEPAAVPFARPARARGARLLQTGEAGFPQIALPRMPSRFELDCQRHSTKNPLQKVLGSSRE